MDRVSLERFLAQGLSLHAIGRRVGRHEATVACWVEKLWPPSGKPLSTSASRRAPQGGPRAARARRGFNR